MCKKRHNIKAYAVIITGALLFGLGCVFQGKDAATPAGGRAFSHKIHLENGLECATCHEAAADGGKYKMPDLSVCQTCHEDTPDSPVKLSAFVKDGQPVWSRVTAIPGTIRFSHDTHLAKNLACADCHKGIDQSEKITSDVALTMESCVACHEEKKAPNRCDVCHTDLTEGLAPESHAKNWIKLHGDKARSGAKANRMDDCSLCHRDSEKDCASCHRDQPPENHNNHWRQRGHGVKATIDRSSCATCHAAQNFCNECHQETAPRSHQGNWQKTHGITSEISSANCAVCHRTQSFCTDCHQTTEPSTHTGAWGSTLNQHCTNCHQGSTTENCSQCHQGTPSHNEAADQPSWHVSGMNCRQCHGAGQPLPHVDNGDNCAACHK